MDKSIYEVTKDEFIGFIDQIKPECKKVKVTDEETEIISIKTDKVLASYSYNEEDDKTHYYVINMPDDNERRPAPAKKRLVLETREEVEAFFDILSKVMKVNKND